MSWPAVNPIWEFCYLDPTSSSGPDGSGLELRNVYLNGHLALKRIHTPMLFADYTTSGLCYRDWKNVNVPFLSESAVRYQLGSPQVFDAITSCDRSNHPTQAFGVCPFNLPGHSAAECSSGVTLEDKGDYLIVTAQHSAAWYFYTSRYIFYDDGSFRPEFGFGNRDGTNNPTTHWHHHYWRMDFDIDGPANDVIKQNTAVQIQEFATLRCNTGTSPSCATERNWEVDDTVTGRGFRVQPTAADYITPANESGHNFHTRDVIGAIYKAGEYGDHPDNQLSDCVMAHANLANAEDLDGTTGQGTDVVLYYRSGVRDRTNEGAGTQDSMICKSVGPLIVPVGDWSATPLPDPLFSNGFE